MQYVVVRTLPKDKLSVIINRCNKISRFERPCDESVERFFKRVAKRLKNSVKTISLVDEGDKDVDKGQLLSVSLKQSNFIIIDNIRYGILENPPTIDIVRIPTSYVVTGLCLVPSIEVIDLDLTNVCYQWEISKHDNAWKIVSTSHHLLLKPDYIGNLIRLGCHAKGVDMVYSNIIGRITEDQYTSKLLGRAIPLSEGCTRIMSYNILADAFMESKRKPNTNYFPYCPREYQIREYREPRIAAEVLAHDPHIICMQEVEEYTFRNSLEPMLPSYKGNITVIRGRQKAGCAMFYKRDLYHEVLYESFPLPDLYDPTVSSISEIVQLGDKIRSDLPELMSDIKIRAVMTQVAVLRSALTNKLVIVGNAHLFWNPEYHVISLLHIHAMCVKIHKARAQLEQAGESISVVICGDMNSMEDSLVHSYLTLGRIPKDHGKWSANESKLSDLLENPLNLKLARGTPNFTNYTQKFKAVIDYVLCDTDSTVNQVTPSPEESDLQLSAGCPSAIFPSDHLPVISDIALAGAKSGE